MNKKISENRKKILKIDGAILKKLANRFNLAKKIGEIKKINEIEIVDLKREESLKKHYQKWAKELNLDLKFVIKLFNLIIAESKKKQL